MSPGRASLFTGRAAACGLYGELLRTLSLIGPFDEEVRRSSIDLVRRSVFASVQPRKDDLVLTIKAAAPIRDARIVKSGQDTKGRWRIETVIAESADVDDQLRRWLADAYELSA